MTLNTLLQCRALTGNYLVPFRSYRSLLFKFRSNAVILIQNFR